MEQRSRRCWISIVCLSRPVALKFGDEDIQFYFRQVTQVALGQIRAAVLKPAYSARSFATSSIISARDVAMRTPPGSRPVASTERSPVDRGEPGAAGRARVGSKAGSRRPIGA
jgi:hypothetical protein